MLINSSTFILKITFFMTMSISALVRPWLDELDGLGWLNFRDHRLASMRYIRDVTIRPELLHAAVHFWDPKMHVFCFGLQELCPTVEEFHAYLGGFDLEIPVIPLQGVNYADVLSSKLGLSKNAARSMIQGGMLNSPRLINQFRPEGFALCLVILAAFLLVRSDNQASAALVEVAKQIEECKDVAPMVLAETLMGLDRVHAGWTNVFEGGALLLHTWLCDKAALLEAVPRNRVHETQGFVQREYREFHRSVSGWVQVLSQLKEDTISWCLNWMDCPTMTVSNMGRHRIVLAGLICWTFYIPYRILRQLGVGQTIPLVNLEDFVMPNFNHATIQAYQRTWRERVTVPRDHHPSIVLSGHYKRWLVQEIEAKEHENQN